MPRPSKPKPPPAERLASLPRRAGLAVEGGLRTLPTYVAQGREIVQPRVVLWLDAATGTVLSVGLLQPAASGAEAEADAAAQVLLTALTEEGPQVVLNGTGPGDAARTGKGKRAARRSRGPLGLPERVLVDDEGVAAAVRALLGPFGVAVERRDDLPAFEAALQSLAESMGLDPDAAPPEPFSWDVDEARLAPLFKASAGLWRRAPWDYMLDHPPIEVRLGERGPDRDTPTLYGSVLGALGEVFGIAFYFSADDFRTAQEEGSRPPPEPSEQDVTELTDELGQLGVPTDRIPTAERDAMLREVLAEFGGPSEAEGPVGRQNALAVLFDTAEEADPTYVAWIKERGLPTAAKDAIPTFLRSSRDADPRWADGRDMEPVWLALDACNQFFSRFGGLLRAAALPAQATHQARVEDRGAQVTIEVRYPADGFPMPEPMPAELLEGMPPWLAGFPGLMAEPEPPPRVKASAAAKKMLYRLKVELAEGGIPYGEYSDVWRRIEMRGDQTLDDLHRAIQKAFAFDDDHLYSFFLSNKAWDRKSEYASPHDGGRAGQFPLEALPMKPRKRFLYLFDYGDDWRFTVTLEGIAPGAVEKGVRYPRIGEAHGEAPPQYPDVDDEDEEDDDE